MREKVVYVNLSDLRRKESYPSYIHQSIKVGDDVIPSNVIVAIQVSPFPLKKDKDKDKDGERKGDGEGGSEGSAKFLQEGKKGWTTGEADGEGEELEASLPLGAFFRLVVIPPGSADNKGTAYVALQCLPSALFLSRVKEKETIGV